MPARPKRSRRASKPCRRICSSVCCIVHLHQPDDGIGDEDTQGLAVPPRHTARTVIAAQEDVRSGGLGGSNMQSIGGLEAEGFQLRCALEIGRAQLNKNLRFMQKRLDASQRRSGSEIADTSVSAISDETWRHS